MKTYFAKKEDIKHDWYIVDATDQTLGRLSVVIADILRGKNKPYYNPNSACGDSVIVINASKVKVSGNKGSDKLYRHYTGYIGGLRAQSFDTLLARNPTEPLRRTVWGMIPHNRLGRQIMKNLKIYEGSEHPHLAQSPKVVEL